MTIRFTDSKRKYEILRQRREFKESDIYINKHLTKKNVDVPRGACMLKKIKQDPGDFNRKLKNIN